MKKEINKMTKEELIKEIEGLEEDLKSMEVDRYEISDRISTLKVALNNISKYDEAAKEIKAITDSFIRAGFTESQAVSLVGSIIGSARVKPAVVNFGGRGLCR